MEWSTTDTQVDFVTLTYDDDHVPRTVEGDVTLDRKDLKRYIRRATEQCGPFRYYAVGEYGDNTRRPHYHMALFPRHNSQSAFITGEWQRGYTSTYPMAASRAAYLAKYTVKKLTDDSDERLKDGQEPEFRTSSINPPIGSAFVSALVRAYRSRAGQKLIAERGDVERSFRFGGKVYPLPRFALTKVRSALGIPELHRDRMAHEGYYSIHAGKDHASWEPEIAIAEKLRYAQKETQNRIRRESV